MKKVGRAGECRCNVTLEPLICNLIVGPEHCRPRKIGRPEYLVYELEPLLGNCQ